MHVTGHPYADGELAAAISTGLLPHTFTPIQDVIAHEHDAWVAELAMLQEDSPTGCVIYPQP